MAAGRSRARAGSGGVVARVPVSATEGILWPALPSAAGAQRLGLLYQLQQSQGWSPDDLHAWQMRQVSVLLDHAQRTVPYYTERLRAAGVRPGAPVTSDVWARIPLLRRADIQDAGDTLHSTELPDQHGPTQSGSTSGSTGRPIVTLSTRITRLLWDVFTLRDHLWHRRDFRGKLASIRAFADGKALYPKGATLRTWGPAVASVFPTGPAVGLSLLATTEQQAQWLVRQNPDILLTFPSAARALARHCKERGITIPRLRGVRTVSEVLGSDTRAACRAAWNVPVVDIYSARETGYIALQCPEHEHYHVQSEGVLVEILDKAGDACAPGEIGRVVVTVLHNFAMPLIRYEVGDYAEVGPPCPCGRGLPVIRRILGRTRSMVRLPGGGQRWPLIAEYRYHEIAPIRQFQVVQKTLHQLEVRLVADRPLTDDEAAQLRGMILDRIRHPFEITLSYHDEIPRGPGGKYEDFTSELGEI